MTGSYLKKVRKADGVKISQLAKMSGVSANTISRFENGKCEMNIGTYMKIIRSLGYRVIFFKGDDCFD